MFNKISYILLLILNSQLATAERCFSIFNSSAQDSAPETLQSLAEKFEKPTDEYRPQVWWHWLGSNFTKEGITKDLESWRESGIGGGCIFNISSSVQESHFPMENNPFPEQTFRSPAYWSAIEHTMKEAKRLGLTMGLHGTPGYATTGGPWIPEERGMKAIISSKTEIEGGKRVKILLPRPELPEFTGYDSKYLPDYKPHKATLYWDVTVMAVPVKENISVADIVELKDFMAADGTLSWRPPAGKWVIYRYGYAPTMAHPHPLPDDIIGRAMEVDKMSREDNVFHWTQLLEPLKQHIGEYFGNTFSYIWVDSYESGYQNWTRDFREQFVRLKSYDPVRWIALYQYKTGKNLEHKFNAWTNNKFETELPEFQRFLTDYNEVVNRLYMDNGFAVAKEMLHKYGLKLYWEPYGGPFSNYEGSVMADVPVDEFWSSQDFVYDNPNTLRAAVTANKRIIAAEAFTGAPVFSRYTETPAFLKHVADGGFAQGMNLYFLHHWVHQPFDNRYQPGLGMGWWGTHFSRFQTWYRESKAFFTYLARCQMLLQQGSLVPDSPSENYKRTFYYTHRRTPEADIFFITNPFDEKLETFAFPIKDKVPELWDAYTGSVGKTAIWRQKGDSVYVDLNLEKDHSVFVIFSSNPIRKNDVKQWTDAAETLIDGKWRVTFIPKTGEKSFTKSFSELADWSKNEDKRVKYFSGTAVYENSFVIANENHNPLVILDLGEVHDMATVEINGKEIAVLWFSPFKIDISDYVKTGKNFIKIYITNTWANRLIGDEQYPADFEWGTDRGEEGRAMKSFPNWFLKNKPRPEKNRKTFNLWYYYRKDSELQPAGLLGPVKLFFRQSNDQNIEVYDLKCEYLTEPIGIDNPYEKGQMAEWNYSPRLSWKCKSLDVENKKQKAFRITVALSENDLKQRKNLLWDSGIIESDKQFCFLPQEIMRSHTKYLWQVELMANGELKNISSFSTGLLKSDWKGKWICKNNTPKDQHIIFRKEFDLQSIPENNTFAFVASCGYHELYVNGVKADDRALAPAVSQLGKRILYVSYDISRLLRKGKNRIEVAYGAGWSMNNYFEYYEKTRQGILVQVYDETGNFSLASDTTWLCKDDYSKNSGKFDFMDMGGELINGNCKTENTEWINASVLNNYNPVLSAQMTDYSKIIEEIPAKKVTEITDDSGNIIYRVDMGKEFTGFLEAKFDGLSTGDTVVIQVSMRDFAYVYVQATDTVRNQIIEEQKQRHIYIARGENGETFRNRFNFFAGRYIHFRGLKKTPELQNIKGLAVSSAPDFTADFESSSPLFNRIFSTDKYTFQMCNTEGVTVDCPNRERLGYGPEGAYQTAWGTGLPCFNSASYYVKNVRDWADVQRADGSINNVAPQVSDMYGCVLNGTAILNIAWEHYRVYGDDRILKLAFATGEKYLEYLGKFMKDNLLTPYDTHGYFLGEWVSPGPIFEYGDTEEALYNNNCTLATALDYYIKIGKILDAENLLPVEKKLTELREAIHNRFYNHQQHSYLNGDQVRTAWALFANIVPDSLREETENRLLSLINNQNYLNVGSFGRFPFFKTVLDSGIYADALANVMMRTSYPSYGYFFEKGCTAFPEMWEIDCPNSTLIHTSYTGISAYFIKYLAGINEASCGYDTILINPRPIAQLNFCNAQIETPFGRVSSCWTRTDSSIKYSFTIPFGATAILKIGNCEHIVSAGKYEFAE